MSFASSSSSVKPPIFIPDVDDLAQAPATVARAILVALCEDQRVRAQALRQLGRLLDFEARERRKNDDDEEEEEQREEEHVEGSARGPRSVNIIKNNNNNNNNNNNSSSNNSSNNSNKSSNPRKRKAIGEPKICVQCDIIFTDDENTFGCCRYHTGELDLMNEDIIEEQYAYELNTEANRVKYPTAFRWCCCHHTAEKPGCESGRHESNPDRSKKGRGGGLSDPEDDPLQLDATPYSPLEDEGLQGVVEPTTATTTTTTSGGSRNGYGGGGGNNSRSRSSSEMVK